MPDTQPTTATDVLLEPYVLSDALTLPNRILMAPMTRCMADDDLVPTAAMAAYYARRAAAGLIISEATIVRPDGQGYPNTPGIFTPAQVAGWRVVTDAVHAAGGRMFLQLWHVGRVSHSIYHEGRPPVAPSAVAPSGRVPRTELTFETPRALETYEVLDIVGAYADGASNAMKAGFDGVEIHGANGYLIDQFLHHHTNRRTDDYGGSIRNMARFALEVVEAVRERVGPARVGLRLSPGAYFNMEPHPGDPPIFEYLLRQLGGRDDLAYVHVGIFDDSMVFENLGGRATEFLRRHYNGNLVGCGSYTPASAAAAIAEGRFDVIAIGRPFIANHDLVEKIRTGAELTAYDPEMLKTLA